MFLLIKDRLKEKKEDEENDYREDEARQQAIGRMKKHAEEKGADAVINVRLETSSVTNAASEIIAYGTAVTLSEVHKNNES